MKRFGYAIRIGGDAEIAGALLAGMERGTTSSEPPTAAHLDASLGLRPPLKGKALGPRAEEGLRNVAMRRHTPDELRAMIAKAQYDYGQLRQPGPVGVAVMRALALVGYGCSWLWRRMTGRGEAW